jgi:hypothetical protein
VKVFFFVEHPSKKNSAARSDEINTRVNLVFEFNRGIGLVLSY